MVIDEFENEVRPPRIAGSLEQIDLTQDGVCCTQPLAPHWTRYYADDRVPRPEVPQMGAAIAPCMAPPLSGPARNQVFALAPALANVFDNVTPLTKSSKEQYFLQQQLTAAWRMQDSIGYQTVNLAFFWFFT